MPTPLPVIADTFRCAFLWRQPSSGQTAVNVMHIFAAGKTAAQVGTELDAALNLNQFRLTRGDASALLVEITKLDGTSATLPFPLANWHGDSGNGDFVPNSSVIISLRTAFRGRAHRGRVFTPFITEADMSDGSISSADAALYVTGWNAFQTALNGAGMAHCVASYDRAHGGAGATQDAVTSYFVPVQLATQRRRQTRLRFP